MLGEVPVSGFDGEFAMTDKEFRRLMTLLGGLSERQRAALKEILERRPASEEAATVIDAAFSAHPCCGHCGSEASQRWGRANGLRRYRCKDCRRTYNALTGTPLAHLHRREVWLAYAQALADGISLRKAADRCGVDLTTSFRWRHRFLESARHDKAERVSGIVEMDETYFLESQKGRRRVCGREPRRRGGVASKRGISDEQVPVLIVRDRACATYDTILADRRFETFRRALLPIVARDAVMVSDGADRGAYRAFARRQGITHVPLHIKAGLRVRGPHHIQNVNAYTSGLKNWIRRFRGVATKYLETYLGWWRMIDRQRQRLTAHACLAATVGFANAAT